MRTAPSAVRTLLAALLLLAAACAPRLQPAGPEEGPPRLAVYPSGRGSFVTADGTRLPLRVWRPSGEARQAPRAVILALHGFNDYSNAFEIPGAALAGHGILTYAYDQRGFGQAPHAGLWPGIETLAADARDALRLIAARHRGLPVYLLGESMGGAVAMVALAGDRRPAAGSGSKTPPPDRPLPIAGAVLVAPAVWARESMPPLYRTVLYAAAHSLPWYPLTGEGLRIQVSDNIDLLRQLARDPFVIKYTRVDAIWGLVNLMDAALAAAPHLPGPGLLLYGLKDQVVPAAPVLQAIESLPPGGDWRIAIYPSGYHLLLRDLQGGRVAEDIAAWIASPAAALPSGADREAVARLGADVEKRLPPDLEEFAPE